MKRLSVLLLILVAAAVTSLVSIGGGALATAGDSIGVCCAWNDELADGILTFKVSGGDDAAQAVVRAAVEELEVVGITLDEITGRPKPNINFKFKPGGGLIAGQAVRKFDDGNIKACDIKISGSAFGDPNNEETVKQITKHEGLHCLGTGHANFDGDLLSPTLDPAFSDISTCDIDTVIAANHWKLADPPGTSPHAPHDTHVHCDGDAVTGGPTVSITSPDDSDTFDSGASILFSATADSDGSDVTDSSVWTWTSDGVEIGTEASFSTTLSDGSHVITASATDADGNTGSASITIGVGVQTILVKSIECTVSGPRLLYTITVVAGSVGGDPVEGATVSGTRVDSRGRTFRFEGDTNADGQVAFRASRPTRGDHVITVENVVEPGFQFDETLGESSLTCTV